MLTTIIAATSAMTVLVGVLETPQCKTEHARSVRVLFAKINTGWISLQKPVAAPAAFPTRWTVAFDGRDLGRIDTVDPGWSSDLMWTYPRDRLLDVVGDAPAIRTGSDHFRGHCSDQKVMRPLVVVSRPNVSDPAHWKPEKKAPDLRAAVFETFRAHAGPAYRCPVDPLKAVAYPYTVADLVRLVSYVDRAGRRLVAVRLNSQDDRCEGMVEPARRPHGFLVGTDGGSPVFLGRDMWLVDAGDYDDDGRSELIFWFSAHNRDGYVLLSENGSGRVEYLWTYF